jgi:hypothetical protein
VLRVSLFVPLFLALAPFAAGQAHHAANVPMGAAVPVSQAGDALTISFSGKTVTIANVTPAGRVLLFAVDRMPATYFFSYQHYALLLQEKANDRTVSIDLPAVPGASSVWIAADIPSGRTAVVVPAGSPYHPISIPVMKGSSAAEQIATPGLLMDFVVVRPGLGAWFRAGGDGASGDAGPKRDRTVTFDVSALEPLSGTGAAAGKLHPHDLLVGINEDAHEYFLSEVQP